MPTTPDPSRGRSRSRRLPPDLLDANRQIQERFQFLRESLYVPEAGRLSRTERRTLQQALLGDALGLEASEIARLEDSREGVPAAVLFRMMERYDLAPSYFTNEEAPLSGTFLVEQRALELEGMIRELRERAEQGPLPAAPSDERARAPRREGRKGGWLKGLPRSPKTPEQLAIRRLWEVARERDFIPTSLDDLRSWGEEQGLDLAETLPPSAGTARLRVARAARRRAPVRKGGWLKGLPRSPKTPEQIEIRRIWDEARRQGRHFSSILDLKAWWAASSAPPAEPAPAPVEEAPPEIAEEVAAEPWPEAVEEAPVEVPVVEAPVVAEAPVKRRAPAPKPGAKAAPKKAAPAAKRSARPAAKEPVPEAPEAPAPEAPVAKAPTRAAKAPAGKKPVGKKPAGKKPAAPKARTARTNPRGGETPPETVN